MDWKPIIRALARRYGYTLAYILSLTPVQIQIMLEEDEEPEPLPKVRDMGAAIDSLLARRELGL